jgi:hypothetical protein
LWRFRQAGPDSPLVPDIETAILRWADYFIRHDFAYDYYGRIRIGVDESVHGLGLFLPLMAMAHRITGNPQCAQILEQRLVPLVREHLLIPEDSPVHLAHPNVTFKFLRWRSNVKGADSCKIAHTLQLAHEVFPQAGWHDQALDLLERFREVTDFRPYHDPDGSQIPPEYAYMRDLVSTQHVGAWLQCYYLAAGGIPA